MRGGDAAFNAAALLAILEGERSPRADLICLNAALALVVAGVAEDLDDGMQQARRAIAGGGSVIIWSSIRFSRRRPAAVSRTTFARRSCSEGRRSARPRATSRSTRPVAFEASQNSAPAISLIVISPASAIVCIV